MTEKHAPGVFKPFAQGFNLDLVEDSNTQLTRIYSGIRVGYNRSQDFLESQRKAGISHIALNLRYCSRPASIVIEEIGERILPYFPAH